MRAPFSKNPWLLSAALLMASALSSLLSQNAAPENGMNAFGKMVPAGFVNRGVSIPSFNNAGTRTSELKAATLTRIDEDRLQADQVAIEIFAENPAQNIRVDLITAIHHMTDQILRSGKRSVVTRSDFVTSGDSLVFDARTSIGSMKGRVRTLIFDTGALSGKTDKAPAAQK